jgi:hypothetical protein
MQLRVSRHELLDALDIVGVDRVLELPNLFE